MWYNDSELVTGLILAGRIKQLPDPKFLAEPYDEVINEVKKGHNSPEHLIKLFGVDVINAAHQRANELNGLAEKTDWNEVLRNSYESWTLADRFDDYSRRLRRGDQVDLEEIRPYLDNNRPKGKIISAQDVEAKEVPLIKSGYAPVDYYIGGYPETGLLTIIGYAKTGKTTLLLKLSDHFLNAHPDKTSLYITTEMTDREVKMRSNEIGASNNYDRLNIVEHYGSINSIYSYAQQVSNLGIIFVDLLDDLIDGEVSEPKMSYLYQTLPQIAREFRIPLVATGQPHGGAGKTLRPNTARWSRMAEGKSYQMWTLYNPSKSYARSQDDDFRFPMLKGCAWILAWLCRGGARPNIQDEKMRRQVIDLFPFAFPVSWSGENGWGDKIKPNYLPISLEQKDF